MTSFRALVLVLVPLCWLFVFAEEDATKQAVGSTTTTRPATTNDTVANNTQNGLKKTSLGNAISGLNVDSSMIQRALYVLIGITMTGVLYFLIRAVRLKRPVQRKKYGLLSNYDESMEMEAAGESDEDDTLYEARSLRR